MSVEQDAMNNKVVLVTGASRRIGAETVRMLHASGMRVVIHYRSTRNEAEQLKANLNQLRPDSAQCIQQDLNQTEALCPMIQRVIDIWGRLDVLVNNASSFYPTPLDSVTQMQWEDLLGANLKAPLFLSQAAAAELSQRQGCIINMVDIHADRPLKDHCVYAAAKAGLVSLTKSLARELGPQVRANGVAPGAIMWPENDLDSEVQQEIVQRTALKRSGEAKDIAKIIRFLVFDAPYITGQIISVDGGRTLSN